jgi:hypothetical protein
MNVPELIIVCSTILLLAVLIFAAFSIHRI